MDESAIRDAILDFWFGPPPHATRDVWFRKDDGFDATIRERFGTAIESALAGAFEDWSAKPHGALSLVILLDQFARNAFRDTSKAFAGDTRALAVAQGAVRKGFDRELGRYERQFLYLPFEHAESPDAQAQSLALFGALARDTGDASLLDWAEKHAAIIRRFGRYPHRNAILGRISTPEEIAFLQEPGSRF